MKRILTYCALITGLAAAIGVVVNFDSYVAKASDLEQVSARLDNKIDKDRLDQLQERMWKMEDYWGQKFSEKYGRIHDDLDELLNFMTSVDRENYRELRKEYEELAAKLKGDD